MSEGRGESERYRRWKEEGTEGGKVKVKEE